MKGKSYERERLTCKGYTGCVETWGRVRILGGERDFMVQGMDIYKEWLYMRCFRNPIICCSTSIIFSIV